MNYIIFGALVIAGFIIIGLGIRLIMTRRRIKQNKRPKKTLAELDKEIMETSSELIKDLPPVNGPEPAVTDADYDNPSYSPQTAAVLFPETLPAAFHLPQHSW